MSNCAHSTMPQSRSHFTHSTVPQSRSHCAHSTVPQSRSHCTRSTVPQSRSHCAQSIPWVSGRIGKVIDSHAEGCKVARSNHGCGWAAAIYTMHEELRGYCQLGWGVCDQSIGSTVSDAIVSSSLWSTATRSTPLDHFCRLLKVVDNWPHILW